MSDLLDADAAVPGVTKETGTTQGEPLSKKCAPRMPALHAANTTTVQSAALSSLLQAAIRRKVQHPVSLLTGSMCFSELKKRQKAERVAKEREEKKVGPSPSHDSASAGQPAK